nr:P-U15 [Pinctada fucata]
MNRNVVCSNSDTGNIIMQYQYVKSVHGYRASVTDLSPKSYYRIKVATAFCRAVESEGPPTIIKTLDIIPSAPLNLKLEGIKPNAFAISWEPPILKGDITNYTIYVTDGAGEPIIVKIDPSTTIYAIYNLYEGTTYDVRVTASSDNGESPQSAPLEVTTDVFSKYV